MWYTTLLIWWNWKHKIRNYIRTKFPDIDNIMSYQEYEDYTANIVLDILKKLNNYETNLERKTKIKNKTRIPLLCDRR